MMDTDEFKELSAKNLNKVTGIVAKAGYKDGKFDGREFAYQTSFDTGYEEGFQNGFLIGKYKGLISAKKLESNDNIQNNVDLNLILEKPAIDSCNACKNSKLLENDIKELVNIQKQYNKNFKSIIEEKYSIFN